MARTKKDIVKENMYNKIMPTTRSGKNGTAAEEETLMPQQQDTASDPKTLRAASAPPAPPSNSLFAHEAGVRLTEKKPSILVNIMERMVAERLDTAFSRFNCCQCDRCKLDVAAIALNKLPPKYVVVDKNIALELLAKQANLDVTTAIIQAILIVRDNPRH